jgi:Zn-dependent protease
MGFESIFTLEYWKDLLYALPALLIALPAHEYAHAYAAYKMGDPTARNLGRMTINPLKHLDPVGFIMLLFAHFGWAKPVPVNSRNFRNYKLGETVVSLSGVAMNLLLAFIFSGVFVLIFVALGVENDALMIIVYYIIIINLNLMLLNLLPIYPLDGYHVFRLLAAKRINPNFFIQYERYGYIILIVLVFSGAIGALFEYVVPYIMEAMLSFFMLFV